MGFSPIGLVVSLAVLAPNLLLVLARPRTPLPEAPTPAWLGWLERGGQALCLVVPAIATPHAIHGWWLIGVVAFLAGYLALWARYLVTRDPRALYATTWRVPVPMAILPVLVFLCCAAWLDNGWIALAASVLAAGHIPASLLIAREVARRGDG